MNMQSTFDRAPAQELATLADISNLCDGRDAAIQHWLTAFDAFHEHTGAAAKASAGGGVSLSIPSGNRYEDTDLARAFVTSTGRAAFAELITAAIDRRCWDDLLRRTNGEALMDREAKEQWRASLNANPPPPFNVETCAATFGHLWENRAELLLRGIANTFSALDRRFRSHDGFKVGARLIIDGALECAGWSRPHWRNYNRRDTLDDVERVFADLDGKPAPGRGIERAIDELSTADLPAVVTGDYFRVRVFKNGNLHLWFERPDLVKQVNLLLAEYYGEAIGDGYNETQADSAPDYHATPAKRFGAFNTSPELAAKVAEYAGIGEGTRVLEPSAGTGELAKVARALGGSVHCVEVQQGLAHELRTLHGFHGARCADFLKLTPADLGTFDVVLMNPPFDRGRDCDHVRHAWQFVKPGGRLVAIMSARAEFGEDARHRALHKLIESAESCYGWTPWHDLPAGSFAHAGTQVNTTALTLRKKRTA